MKYEKLKAELEQITTSHERQMIADGGSRLVLSPNYSINAYELLAILEESERVDFAALSQERKDKVLAQIDSVRDCADAETGVELSLERYEELLDKEKAREQR